MNPPIKPNILINLTELFQRKNWELSGGTVADMSLFGKFCQRLRLFNPDEQLMIIELTEDFVRVGLQDYINRFFESLILLGDKFFDNNEKIYILPLVDPYVTSRSKGAKVLRGKSKSADFLHYMLDAYDWRWFSTKLITNMTLKKVLKSFDPTNSSIVLIDDFVGTGNTAAEVCNIYLKEKFTNGEINADMIKVVSIAAQNSGIKHVLKETGVEVASNILIPKGISDKFVMPELSVKIAHMKEIETKLNILSEFTFGYGQSEAMITFLNKTPNNTFPVYWHETTTKIAPFPRHKVYTI